MLGRIGHDGRNIEVPGAAPVPGHARGNRGGGRRPWRRDACGEPVNYFSSVKNFSPCAKRLGLRKKPRMMAPLGATAS
jgi:hypothetical protein